MTRRLFALIALPLATTALPAQGTSGTAPAQPTPSAAAPANPATLRAAPSGRVRTEITLNAPRVQGQPAPAPAKIWVDYGQPHARGRTVVGALVPFDSVWRTGANSSTTFSTDVDLTIGDTFVPRGTYSLYTLPTRAGWKLIVNRQTGQWGTQYDASRDLARIDLTARTLGEPAESFTITLVPSTEGPPASGRLVVAWGTTELSAPWRVGR